MSLSDHFELLKAADELQFDQLTDFMAAVIAHYYVMLPEEVKAATFALSRDFTPEEEAQVSETPCRCDRSRAASWPVVCQRFLVCFAPDTSRRSARRSRGPRRSE